MLLLGAADEPHAGEAVAPRVERVARRLEQPRVVGEAEVVVGAEVEHLGAVGDDLGLLRAADAALALGEAGLLDPVELGGEVVPESSVHHSSVQSRTTLPTPADAAIAKPRSQSRAGRRSEMTDAIASRSGALVCSIAPIAFQVSNISRP